MKRYLLILATLLGVGALNAQRYSSYFLDAVPQVSRHNLTQKPNAGFYLGLPVLSSMNLGFTSSGFVLSDLFKETSGTKQTITLENIATNASGLNYMSMNMDVDLFGMGFRVGQNGFFDLAVVENLDFQLDYNADLFKELQRVLTQSSTSMDFNFNGLGYKFLHYREYSVGFMTKLMGKLTVSSRLKLLSGLGLNRTNNLDLRFRSSLDENIVALDANIGVVNNLPVFDSDSVQISDDIDLDPVSYVMNMDNRGIGFDLGVAFDVTEKLNVFAHGTDIGSILFADENTEIFSTDNRVQYSPLEITLSDGVDLDVDELKDSLMPVLDREKIEYREQLNTRFVIGGKYALFEKLIFGGFVGTEYFNASSHPFGSASVIARLSPHFSVSASYSAYNKANNNIGASMAFTGGGVQFYVASDNVLAMKAADYAKNFNVQFGLNVIVGARDKKEMEEHGKDLSKDERKKLKSDKDGDGVNDFEDKCPDVKGDPDLRGCPDRDGDKIADAEDECPDVKGLPDHNGCPDSDNDGVKDSSDPCPNEYGTSNGCPDKDEDGVPDSKDECPDVHGSMETNGCPDQDGDGVLDKDDKCPKVAGDKEHMGCPDSDGDGIYDHEDYCPYKAGVAKYLGCDGKDSDSDNVPDVYDYCPYRTGVESNAGCPADIPVPEEERNKWIELFNKMSGKTE